MTSTFRVRPRYEWGDFQAISYCWGSPTREGKIVVDGIKVQIPRSLEDALKQAQTLPEASSLFFWADALSIAQDNLKEKNHQVSMMGEIFSSASAVVAYLGRDPEILKGAVDAVVEYSYLASRRRSKQGDTTRIDWLSSGLEGYYWPYSKIAWPGILSILSSHYWNRLWIIQELALNQNTTLFMCEDGLMTRPMIQRVAEVAVDTTASALDLILEYQPDSRVQTCSELFDTAEQVDSVLRMGRYLWGKGIAALRHSHNMIKRSVVQYYPHGLTQVLDLAQKASCTDPRDKVYGSAGLLFEHLGVSVEPSYTSTTQQVYIEFATTLLHAQGAEEALSWCSLRHTTGLPSWVPDWDVRFPRTHLRWLRKQTACGDDTVDWMAEELCLKGRGLVVDHLLVVSTSLDEALRSGKNGQPTDTASTAAYTKRYCDTDSLSLALFRTLTMSQSAKLYGAQSQPQSWSEMFEDENESNENESSLLREVFWIQNEQMRHKTDVPFSRFWGSYIKPILELPYWNHLDCWRQANIDFDLFGHRLRDLNFACPARVWMERLSMTDRIQFESSLQYEPKVPTQQYRVIVALAALALRGRRLATTATGWLALVPEDAGPGDVVAVLYSVSFPVVLRPRPNREHSYDYIGECYVDGLMEGRAIKMRDAGELVEQEIVLC